MNDFELRALTEPVEVRSDSGRLVASGIAIRYGATSRDLGGFVETIEARAAVKTIQEQDILALHEHDPKLLLGRTSTGTLRLTNSDTELRYEVDLPDTTAGRDVATLLERGDVKGSSFGFRALKSSVKWEKRSDGSILRRVGEIRLRDVSTTCVPAYADSHAEVAYRNLADTFALDLDQVVKAARTGALADLLERQEDDSSDDDGRPPATVHRRPSHWFT